MDEPTNASRAQAAADTVAAYVALGRGEQPWDGITGPERRGLLETNAMDLLVDLMHLFDREGLPWDGLVEQAQGHHRAEVIEAGGGPLQCLGGCDPACTVCPGTWVTGDGSVCTCGGGWRWPA